MTKIIIRTSHGIDEAYPIEDEELEAMIKEGTAQAQENDDIYREVPKPRPRKKVAKKKVAAKSSNYQTKVATAEDGE